MGRNYILVACGQIPAVYANTCQCGASVSIGCNFCPRCGSKFASEHERNPDERLSAAMDCEQSHEGFYNARDAAVHLSYKHVIFCPGCGEYVGKTDSP